VSCYCSMGATGPRETRCAKCNGVVCPDCADMHERAHERRKPDTVAPDTKQTAEYSDGPEFLGWELRSAPSSVSNPNQEQ
jgi:hypothetical protein